MLLDKETLEYQFKKLLYHFGEINWDILTSEAWNDYINNDKKFNDKQIEDLNHFVTNLIETIEEKRSKFSNRELSGKWFIKKKLFGYTIMVEIIKRIEDDRDFTKSPPILVWEKAKPEDLVKLNIKII